MPIHIRPLRTDEIPQITALIRASVRGLQAGDYDEAQREAAIATVFTVDTRLVADGGYFAAETEDGILIGCGGWSARKTLYGGDHQLEDKAPDWLDPAVDAAKIRAIFVHPDWARQGIGAMLLHAAEQAAHTAGFRRYEMGSTLTGVSLYKRSGYRELERIQVPVADGQTIEIVRMTKDAH
ncbi:GNAT family N-acetyltransferase [Granulicella tundricola]|uniref:GCN5-related N-acetyltransferase n=1 Tax=Granulicella tundricola (strain ATCC BAA-1859 / DSM 23138 / MP5ACTX9) TaxID=1198114 RepID=E8X5A9_GRATM|nr:GNAT family N-acetyltransferase [Granulicella tundricola]ADW68373.1 GCN5-related N-acetyltransferase [Granulicella tundricola MP5ACTX9]